MSVDDIETFVVVFPNFSWSTEDSNRGQRGTVSRLAPEISFAQHINGNIQTISTPSAKRGLGIQGLLYVPDLDRSDECYNSTRNYVPHNVTRQADLPPTDYTLIALAPWISKECTVAYLASAYMTTTRGFIFYSPENETVAASKSKERELEGHLLGQKYQYPIYLIPGQHGRALMSELGLYSGNMTESPNGYQIASSSATNPRDYVRLFTKIGNPALTIFSNIWVFLLVVVGALIFLAMIISGLMHLIQRRRRHSLRRRIASGEVNLEALGIKRICVPPEFIEKLPLFLYSSEGDEPKSPNLVVLGENGDRILASTESEVCTASWVSNPSPFTVIDDGNNQEYGFFHKYLPHPQPVCIICLDYFANGITTIRELTCGHIYHPDCIDVYLGASSLCPLCRKSALPPGFCPKVSYAMVRKEFNIRRLRSRIAVNTRNGSIEAHSFQRVVWNLAVNVGNAIFSTGRPDPDAADESMLPKRQQTIFTASPFDPTISGQDGLVLTRDDRVEQRIRELTAMQALIEDPDLVYQSKQKWRQSLSRVFPGFE